MTDPWTQREDERDRQDADYERDLAQERRDRAFDHAPADDCPDCGTRSVEVETGHWICACFTGYDEVVNPRTGERFRVTTVSGREWSA